MAYAQMITMADAEEAGAPACFSEEYAFHERNGTLAPYSGPVYPDYNREDYDYFPDEQDDPSEPPGWSEEEPDPEWVREPPEELKVMPTGRAGHETWCDIDHTPVREHCPPPF